MAEMNRDLTCWDASTPCKSPLLGAVGLAGSGLMIVATIIAVGVYPGGYNLLTQFISELGAVSTYGFAVSFNFCIVIGGFALLFFAVGFCGAIENTALRVSTAGANIAACFGVILVGLVPMDAYPDGHVIASSIAFVGLLLSGVLTAASILVSKVDSVPKIYGLLLLAPVACNVALIFLGIQEGYFGGLVPPPSLRPEPYWFSIFEWLSVYVFIGWVFAVSIHQLT